MRIISLATALLLASCGKKEEAPVGLSARALKAEHRELVTRFAEAVARKDYTAAFDRMASSDRSQLGREEFEESIGRYRESATSAPTFTIHATEDDPKQIDHEGVIEFLVPADLRGRIVEEFAIHFKVADEGFWAIVGWIVDDPEGARILNYYQED